MIAPRGLFPLTIALLVLPVGAQGADACGQLPASDRIAGITSEGEIELASGGLARLSDIRLLEDETHRATAFAWLRQHQAAQIVLMAGPPDRWERIPARISAQGSDLAEGLLERGLAIVDAGENGLLCRPDLLKIEAAARADRRGIWADERNRPVATGEDGRLRGRIGRFTLVEGRILSVGERGQRTYLNFGRNFAQDFTITIPQRTWTIMSDRGISGAALRGRRVRARGVIEEWNGTALTIQVPEMLEVLD